MTNFDDEEFDKLFKWFFVSTLIVGLILLGVGVWAVIEFISWLKTK